MPSLRRNAGPGSVPASVTDGYAEGRSSIQVASSVSSPPSAFQGMSNAHPPTFNLTLLSRQAHSRMNAHSFRRGLHGIHREPSSQDLLGREWDRGTAVAYYCAGLSFPLLVSHAACFRKEIPHNRFRQPLCLT